MVAASHPGRPTGLSAGRVLTRRWNRAVRRLRESDLVPALLLVVASVLIGVAQYVVPVVPLTTLVIPMVIGNLVLAPRVLPWIVVFSLSVLVVVVAATPSLLDGRRIGGVVVIFLIGMVILVSSFRRTRLGVAGVRGESMLVDLRDRIHNQARMPALPEGLVRRGGAPLGRRLVVRRRLPGRLALLGRHLAPGGRRRRRPARASRPGPGRCCSPVPSAGCSARCRPRSSCPPPTTTCSARTGRGVRDGGARQHRPADRRVRAALGRPPARGAAARRVGPLGGARGGGPGARADAERGVQRGARPDRPRRRAAAVHRRAGGDPRAGHLARASTSCSARASGCCGPASSRAPTG